MNRIISKTGNKVTYFDTITGRECTVTVDIDKKDIQFDKLVSDFEDADVEATYTNDINWYNEKFTYNFLMPVRYIGTPAEEIAFRIRVARFFHDCEEAMENPCYELLHYLRSMEDEWDPDSELWMYPEEKEALKNIFLL